MKIEYGQSQGLKECVAYVDRVGHLIVKNMRFPNGDTKSFVFMPDGTDLGDNTTSWNQFNPEDGLHKFYPGDTVTITF